ncbi:hypothetical protein WOLCODRAFT_139464 [Wolfiporia cocos MD-104 SS10]|uniref:PIN domain-containing protein n=1 Tax=Wolfiporia cocos (strain MD-104) TaxID=742152 RepID=A0A2H3J7A2_WOLCO|nr:hypothetical protein WOLCODRAFT_139464 [Wolfiporia cocos MD-104 SS10]
MAQTKGAAIASNKLAMSRALGAAFLNHQVQQLEKTVTDVGPGGGNWRERRNPNVHDHHKRSRAAPAKAPSKRDGEVADADFDRTRKREAAAVKDADIIVVDASVLVHALSQVKKWCRDGREEVIIVPLEALNTLDLLKKGMSSLAQRARAASRILEAQVGTNPRIRVQRDDAFVLWDSIFDNKVAPPTGSPEWVRRTICCARWEVNHATAPATATAAAAPKPRVVLAVLSQSAEAQSEAIFPPHAHASSSPVPLPAPQTNRHEPRSSGALVTQWAAKAGIEVFEVTPGADAGRGPHNTSPSRDAAANGRRSPQTTRQAPEGERKRGVRRNSYRFDGERPVMAGGRAGAGVGLVERPPAVMAMMEMVAQPQRVVRVLARGEKLEPDT